MATLKGQNFRILTYDTTASKYKCVGMATSCTITMTNNTDQANTKDDVGLATKPVTTSKSWKVQVESLDVSDVGAMLTDIKAQTKFKLLWDETSTTNNQTIEEASEARFGDAYLSDATFQFDDRTNSQKNLTFTGTGPINTISTILDQEIIPVSSSYTKGQFIRLFLSSDNTSAPVAVLAASKSLSIHVSMTMENMTTKDTTGEFEIQEATELSYDITTNALVKSGETITSLVGGKNLGDLTSLYYSGTPVKWLIANVSGDNNRTKGAVIVSGLAILTQLQINAAVRSNATYDATLNGYGDYTVGS